jgi:hypothetical protein
MTAALMVLFWGLIALIGAMGAFCFIAALGWKIL